jgi:hypothetical protein
LKRYKIKPECWDEFMDIWREIVVMRRKYGFGIVFAFADREINWFTWAINHDGDFDTAAENYYKDPQRVDLDRVEDYVSEWESQKVESLDMP